MSARWVMVLLVMATACGSERALQSAPIESSNDAVPTDETDGTELTLATDVTDVTKTTHLTEPAFPTAPTFAVESDDGVVTVKAGSYCVPGGCADGVFDPATFTNFGASQRLVVTTPMGWPMTASFRLHGETCGASQDVLPAQVEPGVFRLEPAGHAGTYDVTLFAQGRNGSESNGDAIATIVWTTTTDGPLATPTAHAAVLADHDGIIDSYGVELNITNMATQPVSASATITVTSSEGKSISLHPPAAGFGEDCPFGAVGTLYFRLDAAAGQQAAALGTAPFTYDISLTLDGTTYTANAIWPTNEMADDAPNVELHFDPPLPTPI
jgi:hypothetical protein